ncbi:MAG: polyphosphate kinase 1 [Leeuwenhoekiella sp.]
MTENPFKHRDLNWLSFNARVLQEAEDKTYNPLYERMKFLAIYSSNLDEYFRVRVSQLRQMKRVEKSLRKKLALHPSKTVKKILGIIGQQQDRFGKIFKDESIPELEANNILLLKAEDFNETQQKLADIWFITHLAKDLEILKIDLRKDEKPFLEDRGLYFCLTFKNSQRLGFIEIPTETTGRFITLGEKKGKHYITFVDDLIRNKKESLFPDEEITGIYEIKLSRDAELYLDDELEGILAERIYKSLDQRQKGQPTRLLYDASMPKAESKKLRKLLGLGKIDMMPGGRYHNFNDFFSFPDPTNNPVLHFDKKEPILHNRLSKAKSFFNEIAKKDQLVHFPFMSFSYVEQFVEEAANDEDVTEIKISLYRVAEESVLTSALLSALKNGKKVSIFIEAKARFDEENNIDWGRKFEEAGARVTYSYPRIKVHSKILLINRREKNDIKRYVYIGTGNFNGETSKIYSDHGLFTAHTKITKELSRVFEVLEGELIIPRNKHLLVSPFTTRRNFEKFIHTEIEHARNGKKAMITAKMNSLEDREMTELLYTASQAGVEIRLIVRGFSCLVPGIEGVSDNIFMTSIVDRYLEHGRIYLFHNGGEEKLYIGSADLMTRNLDRRIEVLTPIYDQDLFKEVKDILNIQMRDNRKARIHNEMETNDYVSNREAQPPVRSQYAIYDYLKQKNK